MPGRTWREPTLYGEVESTVVALHIGLHLTGGTGAGHAHVEWLSGFLLAPGDSATISGMALLSVQGTGIAPLGTLAASSNPRSAYATEVMRPAAASARSRRRMPPDACPPT